MGRSSRTLPTFAILAEGGGAGKTSRAESSAFALDALLTGLLEFAQFS
jgi:hypothetical protein